MASVAKMSPASKAWLDHLVEASNQKDISLSADPQPDPQRKQQQAALSKAIYDAGLPTRKQEDWQYTSVLPIIQHKFTPPPALNDVALDLEAYLPPFEVSLLVIVDGVYQPQYTTNLEKGTRVELCDADDSVQAVQNHDHVFGMMNHLFSQQVLKITQTKATYAEKPLFVLHVVTSDLALVPTQTQVVVEAQAELTMVEQFVSINECVSMVLPEWHLDIAPSAIFKQVVYQSLNQQSFYFSDQKIQQAESSSFDTLYLALGAQIARHQNRLDMKGEHCESAQNSVVFGEGNQTLDSRTHTRHLAENGQSNQLHKYVLTDQAKGVFDGMIYVDQQAQKTDGQMDNRNLILSTNAKMNTKPKLEIYADDVKCSHGCASGQMDDEQVFYMQARGIRKQDAFHLITQAFLLEPLETVSHVSVKNWLTDIVNSKLTQLKA